MFKHLAAALFLASSALGTAAAAQPQAVRVDATSKQTAEASYKVMMDGRSEDERRKLSLAILVLNLEDVGSAREAMQNPELNAPSIGRIKDKVAGLTADEIIALAARSTAIHVETPAQ